MLTIVGALLPLTALAAERQALTLGVHPYLSNSRLHVRFTPLARYLADRLGVDVTVRVGRDYQEHIRETGTDRLDIAYLGPVSYISMTDQYGAKPLLARLERGGKPILEGQIIVPERSPIRQLTDLRGKIFAFGDPASTMSSVVPQAYLKQAGVDIKDLAQAIHFRGHTNVALAVLTGQADAGAVKNEVFTEFRGRGLRSLSPLPGVPEHLFVTRADMPPAMVERLRSLLLDAHRTRDGRRALHAIHENASGLTMVTDADYDSLRDMLKLLDD